MNTIMVETDQLVNDDKLDQLITEVLKKLIPKELSEKISSKKNRRKLLDEYGDQAFLIPKKLKFPIINPDTGQFDCSLIYAARTRLRQYSDLKLGYKELIESADLLAYENNCNIKIPIQIQDNEELINIDLLDIIEALT